MRSLRRATYAVTVAGVAALTILSSGSSAFATTLTGDWAPFTRCPVDNSSMLAADGASVSAGCVQSDSPNGSIKIGNTTLTTGDSNLQLGALFNVGTGASTLVGGSGGTVVAAPVQIPGGLLGLMCPSNIPVVSQTCNSITNNQLNAVTATVVSAGAPSNLNTVAPFIPGATAITLPVKIQLSNPLLGNSCFIGSNSNPIVLNPQTQVAATNAVSDTFDANGTSDPSGPLSLLTVTGATLSDTTFAVPGASGCGLLGVLDPAVDLKQGLPSASGHNSLTLNNVTFSLAEYADPTSVAPSEGQDLSSAWHSAVTG
jgi:hypothetical protein